MFDFAAPAGVILFICYERTSLTCQKGICGSVSKCLLSLIQLLAPLATITPRYLFGNNHAGVQPGKLMKMCLIQIKFSLMAFMMTTIYISTKVMLEMFQ